MKCLVFFFFFWPGIKYRAFKKLAKGMWSYLFNGYRLSDWEHEKVLAMDGDDSCKAV